MFIVVGVAVLLQLSSLITAEVEWGTFRPHSLIAVRATAPHSPFFGFAYHAADSLNIRHVTNDNQNAIASFSWSRHDGRTFGDQEIRDVGLNLLVKTSFLNHPTHKNACALRVAAEALDQSKPIKPISLVFYAVAAPEELDPRTNKVSKTDEGEWGSLGFEGLPYLSDEGLRDDVRIVGHANSIGGRYSILLKQPSLGSLSVTSFSEPTKTIHAGGASGSRSLIRSRADKPPDPPNFLSNFHVSSSVAQPQTAWAIEKILSKALVSRSLTTDGTKSLYVLDDSVKESSPGAFVQRILQPPFEIDASFVLHENRDEKTINAIEDDITGDNLTSHLENRRNVFDNKFEHVYQLNKKGLNEQEQVFAKAALSNVLGGIGFFYGSSLVKTGLDTNGLSHKNVVMLPPISLFTATPSRVVFPRGFLWDEGFHQLIVQSWDPALSQKCLLSWMKVGQDNGWIPREQVLGIEARERFPEHVRHLMVQDPAVANPPTILMPLYTLLSNGINLSTGDRVEDDNADDGERNLDLQKFTRSILSPSIRYYSWLKSTQSGHIPDSFRWRGRSDDISSPDGYPLTLASGLDDYPRALAPNSEETHVDLHSWMAWASWALSRMSLSAGDNTSATEFLTEHRKLKSKLIEIHGKAGETGDDHLDYLMCDHDGMDKVCHIGYPTILPLLLGLLDPGDKRVGAILHALQDPSLLRTRAGIRSLSKSDEWHRKGNDYWTGSVWMPFNYLALAALRKKYSIQDGPYRFQAEKLYNELRKAVLENAFNVYMQTGHLWENYSPDDDGHGKSGRQFTGWSALVLLIYADKFNLVIS
ncbi:Mannosyl-oligosaccharide glucosidase [Gracilariopsis chorda]|uniref:Mannosyl-oligosaccharide glucosidase n=1 Tax=Gracilariopsis chorda TaxID=448386 RepID=A0A2V3IM78_9FLOR|nr:Mannosyl-oligosaccharide glucosidase [Gracilariopsis chorda]|eukprot:PXF43147.1 Mannosyl-oligosaccharide glucosidase [Gracilariopsis chorda]